MENTYQFNSGDKLLNIIVQHIRKHRITKIRFFEKENSYEDYSISYTLAGKPILNFNVETNNGFIRVCKKAKKSTRHIQFPSTAECVVEYVQKHVSYLAIKVQDEIYYTDGTHRYKK